MGCGDVSGVDGYGEEWGREQGRLGGEWTLFHIGDAVRIGLEKAIGDVFKGSGYYKDGLIMADVLLCQIVPSTLYWYAQVEFCSMMSVMTFSIGPLQQLRSIRNYGGAQLWRTSVI